MDLLKRLEELFERIKYGNDGLDELEAFCEEVWDLGYEAGISDLYDSEDIQ